MATIQFKLVDESIAKQMKKQCNLLICEENKPVDDQKCKYCEKRWPIKAKIRKHRSIKAFSIFRSSSS